MQKEQVDGDACHDSPLLGLPLSMDVEEEQMLFLDELPDGPAL